MKQKSQYIFIFLLMVMLYLIYLVLSYIYNEYQVTKYVEEIQRNNLELAEEIKKVQQDLEYKNTKAYKNKIIKAERGLKNLGETVVFLIEEESYNIYTSNESNNHNTPEQSRDLIGEESLILTMNVYQRWIYFIFKKDIR